MKSLQEADIFRIGETAARTGLTPRTIRYYEEIGLLRGVDRDKGRHRHYDADDVERLQLIARLRDLLGLTLEELDGLVAAQGAWLVPSRPWREAESLGERVAIIDEALAQIEGQIASVRKRISDLGDLERDLLVRRSAIESKRLTESP